MCDLCCAYLEVPHRGECSREGTTQRVVIWLLHAGRGNAFVNFEAACSPLRLVRDRFATEGDALPRIKNADLEEVTSKAAGPLQAVCMASQFPGASFLDCTL